jgi:HPt (histidine-containing phosphotransfer) domain-containing protein
MTKHSGMNILVLESESSSLEKLKSIAKLGHTVHFCESGQDALALVDANSFDIALLNFADPILKATEVMKAVIEKQKTKMPVFASLGASAAVRGLNIQHFLLKPLKVKEMLEFVESFSRKDMASSKEIKSFDREGAIRICDGDEDLFKEIVGIFQKDSFNLMQNLKTAVMAQDLRGIESGAHSLKGAAGNICAIAVRDRASAIERAAQNKNVDQVRQAFILLIQEYKDLIRTLNTITSPP